MEDRQWRLEYCDPLRVIRDIPNVLANMVLHAPGVVSANPAFPGSAVSLLAPAAFCHSIRPKLVVLAFNLQPLVAINKYYGPRGAESL